MNPFRASFFAAGTAVLWFTLALTPASAQTTVTWGTPQSITAASDVDNRGTIFASYTAYSSALTVNGVTFQDLESSANLTVTSVGHTVDDYGFTSTGDANYDHLVRTGVFSDGGGAPSSITLSNLVVGHSYLLQIFTPSWDSLSWPTTFTAGSNSVAMGNTTTVPTYVSGTFTAASSDLTITYQGSAGQHGLLAAVAVNDVTAVPEPATCVALAGVLALGTVLWRRRAARQV